MPKETDSHENFHHSICCISIGSGTFTINEFLCIRQKVVLQSHSALLTCKSKLNKDQDRESYNAKPKLPVTKPLGPAPFLSQKVRTAHKCTRNRIRTIVRMVQPPQTV